jgi:hypothetical protein
MRNETLYINKYLPVALLYFFFNGVFLPLGILYTTLLAPLFLVWLWRYPAVFGVLRFFFYWTIPLAVIHAYNGIGDVEFYVKSYAMALAVFVFGMAFYQYLENCHTLRYIFKKILILNGIMTVAALIFLFVPPVKKIFWYNNNMSLGHINFLRLQMLTYEPSYYSTLFAPIVLYYLLKVFKRMIDRPWLYIVLTLIPLFLSLSFGVILGLALALFILLVWESRNIIFKKSNFKYLMGGTVLLVAVFVVMAVWFPNNVLFKRMSNVFSGRDLSFNGRTSDSFVLAEEIASKKSYLFGTGFGQVKLLGLPVFKRFYNYAGFTVHEIGIPNTTGDLFATLGLVTVALKFFFEFYFFFKTRVSSNYYRLGLWLFIFIYQFTGSFMTNIAEYVIWILAFRQDLFPEFNKNKSANRESPVYRASNLI